jgi:hypothetical protein
VWPTGELSGYHVSREIHQQLDQEARPIERRLRGVEVMGSGTVIRLFDRMSEEWEQQSDGARAPWYDHRVVCCVIRPGPNSADEADHIRRETAPKIAAAGVQIVLVESTPASLRQVSSAEIRTLIAAGDWNGLRARGYVDARICDALESRYTS